VVDPKKDWENHIYLRDFIQIRPSPKLIKNAELAQKYLRSTLSAQQLADEYGVSKQMILGRLREAGVRGGKGRGRAADNFRFPNPVFGNKVVGGRLETNPTEMKIVRLVVELRDRHGWSFEKIAGELNRRGHRNRKGTKWHRVSTGHVHKNWTGKV
jgi:hypothetical protein